MKEDNLAANSTMEVVTAKKKIETGLCGDKKKIFKQSIVDKEEQTTATKMERKKAWLRKKKIVEVVPIFSV